MELLDEKSRRTLAYLAALNRGGYKPRGKHLRAYAEHPDRESRTTFHLLQITAILGSPRTEPVVDYLVRLGAIRKSDGYEISALGLALLPALEESTDYEQVIEVIDAGDDMGLPRIMAKIGAAGGALLADPYLKADDAFRIITRTRISRILVGERNAKKDRNAIEAALSAVIAEHEVEVRVAGRELHDRFLIPDTGPVTMIGGSLSAASKNLMVLTDVADAQGAIRNAYEKLWRDAALLVKTRTPEATNPDHETPTTP